MKSLSDFLQKFKIVLSDKTSEIRAVQKVFQELFNVEIPDSNIEIKKTTLYLSVSPLLKNKIFLSKESILQKLRTSGLNSITEIR